MTSTRDNLQSSGLSPSAPADAACHHDPAIGAISEAVAAAERSVHSFLHKLDDLDFNDDDVDEGLLDYGSFDGDDCDSDDWSLDDDEVDITDLANELRAAEEGGWIHDKDGGGGGGGHANGPANDPGAFEGSGRRARARRARIKREIMEREAAKEGGGSAEERSSLARASSSLARASSSLARASSSSSSLAKAAASPTVQRRTREKRNTAASGRNITNDNIKSYKMKQQSDQQRGPPRQGETNERRGERRVARRYEQRRSPHKGGRTPTKAIEIGKHQSQTAAAATPAAVAKPFEGAGRRARARKARQSREGTEGESSIGDEGQSADNFAVG